VRALLDRHLAFAKSNSPPEDVHALEIDGLVDHAVTFFSYRVDGELFGVGALKQLDETHAELKSMHTAEEARRRGIGRAMVDHLVGVARDRGFRRVSLETGSTAAFAPARSLYERAGFGTCGPFGDYWLSPYSTFMTLSLEDETRLSPTTPSGSARRRDKISPPGRGAAEVGSPA
jgi:putative acetyltransferase